MPAWLVEPIEPTGRHNSKTPLRQAGCCPGSRRASGLPVRSRSPIRRETSCAAAGCIGLDRWGENHIGRRHPNARGIARNELRQNANESSLRVHGRSGTGSKGRVVPSLLLARLVPTPPGRPPTLVPPLPPREVADGLDQLAGQKWGCSPTPDSSHARFELSSQPNCPSSGFRTPSLVGERSRRSGWMSTGNFLAGNLRRELGRECSLVRIFESMSDDSLNRTDSWSQLRSFHRGTAWIPTPGSTTAPPLRRPSNTSHSSQATCIIQLHNWAGVWVRGVGMRTFRPIHSRNFSAPNQSGLGAEPTRHTSR